VQKKKAKKKYCAEGTWSTLEGTKPLLHCDYAGCRQETHQLFLSEGGTVAEQ